MTWASLALLGWLYGAAQGWWPTPLGFAKRGLARTKNRWSEPDFTPDDDEYTNFANPDDDVEEIGGGALIVSRPRIPWGPRPLDELLDDDDEEEDLPPRRTWVASQVAHGRRPTDIKTEGARLFGCTTRTIDNDLRHCRERGSC